MKGVILAAVVAASLSGCASLLEIKGTGQPVAADDAYVASSLRNLKESLKDPESARISGVYTVKTEYSGDQINVCGFVNAKNSYGGYVGKKLFVARPDIVYIERTVVGSDYEAMTENNYVVTYCKLRDGERPVLLPQYDN